MNNFAQFFVDGFALSIIVTIMAVSVISLAVLMWVSII